MYTYLCKCVWAGIYTYIYTYVYIYMYTRKYALVVASASCPTGMILRSYIRELYNGIISWMYITGSYYGIK